MQQKKDGLAKQTSASKSETRKCGECLHFKATKYRNFDNVCSALGVKQFAVAPTCYTPDYTKVIQNTDEFVQLSMMLADKTPQQKKIMMSILRQAPVGKKLRMGTKMYLNFRGREYISNYVCGYVVGYTSANEIVLCGSPDQNSRGKTFFAYLQSDQTLLTPKEWKERKEALLSKGRIQDPTGNIVRDITAKVQADTYEVPTIDNAPIGQKKKGKKGDEEHRQRRTGVDRLIMTF